MEFHTRRTNIPMSLNGIVVRAKVHMMLDMALSLIVIRYSYFP
jgi:hypothetical protein